MVKTKIIGNSKSLSWVILIGFLIGAFGLSFSIYLFYNGYSMYDFGQNMMYMEKVTEFKITDITLSETELTGLDLYRLGNLQSRLAFRLAIFSGLLTGFSFNYIVRKMEK